MRYLTSAVPLASAAALAATGCWATAAPQAPPMPAPVIAFVHANVVDVERGVIWGDRTIVISGDRILTVVRSARAVIPAGAEVVDVQGAYVIPGLWDMHAHVLDDNFEHVALVLVSNGITGVRHPGNSSLDMLRAVRERARQPGIGPLPRLISAGVLIDGSPPVRPAGSVTLERAEDARGLVDSLLAGGVDFLKVYSRLGREPFFALAAEARRRHLTLAGHVPIALTPEELSDAGVRSIEHVFEFPLACSTRERDMRRWRNDAERRGDRDAVRAAVGDTVLRSYDHAKCARILGHLARNGTFVTPTLYLYKRTGVARRPTPRDSEIARYFAGEMPNEPGLTLPEFSGGRERSEALYSMLARITGDMHRAGVPLLAGTDTQTRLIWAGFSLHDELVTLVEDAGLSPADALRAATLNPARYFAAIDSMGTVAPGKVADLVLLEANPLADIRNAGRVRGVVLRGRHMPRAALDSLLARAERAAAAAR